jgi:four helix bundle protein
VFIEQRSLYFLTPCQGLLLEVETQLLIAEELRWVSETEIRRLLRLVEALAGTLNALIKSLNPMAA